MSPSAKLSCVLVLWLALGARAHGATEDCRAYTKPRAAHMVVAPRSHALVYDAAITDSPYRAGDVIVADAPVMRMIVPAIQEQLDSANNRITDDRVRLGDISRISEINRLELDSYRPLTEKSVSDEMRRKIMRSDEIDALQANIASLTEQQRRLDRVARTIEGRFVHAIYLLTDPPRKGEIAKAGTPVFDYVYLDSMSVAVHADDLQGTQPPDSLAIRLGATCVIASYVSSTNDRIGTGSELVYRAAIDPRVERSLVPLLRTPRAMISAFQR
jgi:hypothetical protein